MYYRCWEKQQQNYACSQPTQVRGLGHDLLTVQYAKLTNQLRKFESGKKSSSSETHRRPQLPLHRKSEYSHRRPIYSHMRPLCIFSSETRMFSSATPIFSSETPILSFSYENIGVSDYIYSLVMQSKTASIENPLKQGNNKTN